MSLRNPYSDDLDGIDQSSGLRYADGNPGLYQKLLLMFAGQLNDEFSHLVSQIESGARDAVVCRQTHTLKGIARTVGALRLGNAAARVNDALKADAPLADDDIAELREAFDVVTCSLASRLHDNTSAPLASEAILPGDRNAVGELLQAVEGNRWVNDSLLASALRYLHGIVGDEGTCQLRQHIERFQYEQATVLLKSLIRQVEEHYENQ